MSEWFRRRGRDNAVVFRLPADVAELLAAWIGQLEHVMRAGEPGPVTDRLFPRAYLDPTEEEAEREWQSLVHGDLVEERVGALVATAAELRDATRVSRDDVEVALDDDAALRWCMVLNDARLTLGTALDIQEDDQQIVVSDDDPRAAGLQMYDLFTELQYDLLEVLAAELPEEGTNGDPAF